MALILSGARPWLTSTNRCAAPTILLACSSQTGSISCLVVLRSARLLYLSLSLSLSRSSLWTPIIVFVSSLSVTPSFLGRFLWSMYPALQSASEGRRLVFVPCSPLRYWSGG
ncbi:hypothetical protein EJB05_49785, partial [Eragrostis curvula]